MKTSIQLHKILKILNIPLKLRQKVVKDFDNLSPKKKEIFWKTALEAIQNLNVIRKAMLNFLLQRNNEIKEDKEKQRTKKILEGFDTQLNNL